MGDVLEPQAEQLLLRVAEHLAQRAVDLGKAPVEVVEGHADGGVVEGAAEEPLGLAQLPLCPLTLGDVHEGLHRPGVRALGVVDRRPGGGEYLLGPVGGGGGDLVGRAHARAAQLPLPQRLLPLLRLEEVDEGSADHLFLGEAQDLRVSLVAIVDEPALRGDKGDPLLDGLHEGAVPLLTLLEVLLGPPALGDVAHDAGEEDVVLHTHLPEGEVEQELGTVLAQAHKLDRAFTHDVRLAAFHVAPEARLVRSPEPLGHEHPQGPADDLPGRVAEDLLGAGVEGADQAVFGHGYDPVWGRLYYGPGEGLTLLQFLFGPLALGDVYHEPLPVAGPARLVLDQDRLVADPHRPPVAMEHAVLVGGYLARLADGLVPGAQALAVLGVYHAPPEIRVLAVLRGVASQDFYLRTHVHRGVGAAYLLDVDDGRDSLDEVAIPLLRLPDLLFCLFSLGDVAEGG